MTASVLDMVKGAAADELAWLALADWLEEQGQVGPAELHRLGVQLRRPRPPRGRAALEERLRSLIAGGVRPVVPTEVINLGRGVAMTLALIPPGSFWMGSPTREPRREAKEGPRRRVTLTRPFYLGIHLVTQGQWRAVTGDPPSPVRGARYPKDMVSWDDCSAFCRSLSDVTGRPFRLPTEAEWEYACRAGTSTAFHTGPTLTGEQANFDASPDGPYRQETVPVGSFPPNAFGLFDTHGNLSERCQDRYDDAYYGRAPAVDPPGPAEGSGRVVRGGSWNGYPHWCRSAYRGWDEVVTRGRYAGCRVVMEA